MDVKVPHILTTRRFIMLPGRHPMTALDLLKGESDPLGDVLDTMGISLWEIVARNRILPPHVPSSEDNALVFI